MKVGVISRGSPDYLIDIVTDGLIRLLGRHQVSLNYNVRGGWGGNYVHLLQGFNGPEPFDIHDADVLIGSLRSLPAIKAWKKRTGKTRVAILDGEDVHALSSEGVLQASVYFKREYLKGKSYLPKIKPLPFAAIPEAIPKVDVRDKRVFYSWHPTHQSRRDYGAVLASMGFPQAPNQEKAKYNVSLARSRIGVVVRGNGWDTYRYWETPYFGAAMLVQLTGIVIPGDFKDGREAIFFSGLESLKAKLKWMLKNEFKTAEIAKAGTKACLERHLSIHRAKTVLEALV